MKDYNPRIMLNMLRYARDDCLIRQKAFKREQAIPEGIDDNAEVYRNLLFIIILNKKFSIYLNTKQKNPMKSTEFYLSTEKDTIHINLIVQTAKNNNSTTQFTNAQKAALIATADTAIDNINTMRTEIYAAQGITETFAAYDNTAAGSANIYTQVTSDVRSLRIEFSEVVAEMTARYTNNTLVKIVDDLNNATLAKSGTYLTAQAAAITAIAALQTALFV